jgi:hypothetical protein
MATLAGTFNPEYRSLSISGGTPQPVLKNIAYSAPDVGSIGQIVFLGPHNHIQISRAGVTKTLVAVPAEQNVFLLRLSADGSAVAYFVLGMREDDPNEGLWVVDNNGTPHQIFHGWVDWYAPGPKNQIYLIQGKADMKGVLWKVDWSGHGLTRVPLAIPLPFDYWFPFPFTQFDVSPIGQHLAFTTQEVFQANIGMLENID